MFIVIPKIYVYVIVSVIVLCLLLHMFDLYYLFGIQHDEKKSFYNNLIVEVLMGVLIAEIISDMIL